MTMYRLCAIDAIALTFVGLLVGFTRRQCEDALQESGGNVVQSISLLLHSPGNPTSRWAAAAAAGGQ